MKPTINEYIDNVRSSLEYLAAREFYFPHDKERRIEANLRLGRELGFGLASYHDYKKVLGETYGSIIVKYSFGTSIGVVINNDEWIGAIKEGIKQYNDWC